MLNKKILAASIAATLSTSAFGAIDLNATGGFTAVKYANELTGTGATFEVTDGGTVLNVTTNAGFVFAAGTDRYVRFDLANANFASSVASADLTTGLTGSTVTKLSGGEDGDNFVIFEVSDADEPFAVATDLTLALGNLDVSSSSDVAITYSMFEDLTVAANNGDSLYTDAGNVIITRADAVASPVITASTSPEATVASGFENFDTSLAVGGGADQATLGRANFGGSLAADVLRPSDSAAVTVADLFDATYTATLTGDTSFGDWYLSNAADCSSNDIELTEAEDGASAFSAANAVARTDDVYACVEVANISTDDEIVNKGSYSLELDGVGTDVRTGDLASIAYDTVTVEVPYLTTFSDYNQRVYMVNQSSNPVFYTFDFTSEGVATATAGSAATGTIPAGEMVALRATDIVTMTGRQRTAATLELEATTGQVIVTTQTVNLSDGSTDTVLLSESN